MKLCKCGCGKPAPIAAETDKRWGVVGGQPRYFIHGHNRRNIPRHFNEDTRRKMSQSQRKRFSDRTKHWRWRGGMSAKGYEWVYRPDHRKATKHGYIKRYLAAIEDAYGPIIPSGWDIHHVNGNKTDDRLTNLAIMPHADHMRYHARIAKRERREYASCIEDQRNFPN